MEAGAPELAEALCVVVCRGGRRLAAWRCWGWGVCLSVMVVSSRSLALCVTAVAQWRRSWSAAARGARWRNCWDILGRDTTLRAAVRGGGHARRGLAGCRDARAALRCTVIFWRTAKSGHAYDAQVAADPSARAARRLHRCSRKQTRLCENTWRGLDGQRELPSRLETWLAEFGGHEKAQIVQVLSTRDRLCQAQCLPLIEPDAKSRPGVVGVESQQRIMSAALSERSVRGSAVAQTMTRPD